MIAKFGFVAIFNILSNIKTPMLNPSRPDPGRREKIIVNFYFHSSFWCLKRFYGIKGITICLPYRNHLLEIVNLLWKSVNWFLNDKCEEKDIRMYIRDVLRDFVPFVQFKKRGKHLRKSVSFIKLAGFSLKLY